MYATDPATAAYAIEVLLRAAQDGAHLQAVLQCLESAPLPVLEHAIQVLAAQGLIRAREVFSLGDWSWATELADGLLAGSHDVETTWTALVGDGRQDHLLVGLIIATLASEHDERAVRMLEQSETEWIRDYAALLRGMFSHRWRSSNSGHVG